MPADFKEELTSLVQKVRKGNPTVRIIALRKISQEHVTDKPWAILPQPLQPLGTAFYVSW